MTTKLRKRGTIVLPKEIRDRLGIEEGTLLIVEEHEGAIVIRPAVAIPVEVYSMRRKAELLLNNAVDQEDYAKIVEEVRRMGFDPNDIPHEKPGSGGDNDRSGNPPPVS